MNDQPETSHDDSEFEQFRRHRATLDSILSCIDGAVNPRLTIQREIAAAPVPNPKQIAAAGHRASFTAPKILIEQIDALQKKFDQATALMQAHTPSVAHKDWNAREESNSAQIISSESIEHITGETREMFYDAYRKKMQSAAQLSKTYGPKATELVRPHLTRYVELVRAEADLMAQKEQSRYADFGLPWKPSHLLLHVYKCAQVVEDRLHGHIGSAPKDVADFVYFMGE